MKERGVEREKFIDVLKLMPRLHLGYNYLATNFCVFVRSP